MIYAIIGLVFGIIGGILTPGFVPKVYAPYFSVALMGMRIFNNLAIIRRLYLKK